METYKSKCPDCSKTYRWIGYKTGLGKSPEQLEQMTKDHTICKFCGSQNLKTDFDDIGLVEAMAERIEIDATVKEIAEAIRRKRGLL